MPTSEIENMFKAWIAELGIKLTRKQYGEWFTEYFLMAVDEGFWN